MTEENVKDVAENTDVVFEHPRTSKVTKGINRRIWTAKYEGIEICSSVEEVIEWNTLKERQQKLDAVTKHVTNDFKRTSDAVLAELGLTHVSAWSSADNDPEPVAKKAENKIDSKKINNDLFDRI